jgi:hypothetical protein
MKLKGANQLQVKLYKMSQDSTKIVGDIVRLNANEIASEASRNAPKMFKTKGGTGFPTNGEINQSIATDKVSELKYTVSVNSVMGAYAEFGTGAFVDVPEGWKEIAWSYYVNGKGMIMPTPYFIPAFRAGKERILKDLQNYLSKIDK